MTQGRPVTMTSSGSLLDRLLKSRGLYKEDLNYKFKHKMEKIKTILENVDWKKFGQNTLTYSAPFLLVFLVAIQGGQSVKDALYVLYLYALNVLIDFLRKVNQARK